MPPVRVDRELPFKLSMTVDFFGDGGRGLYTPQTLDLMMREARRLGVTRVYWQYLGDLEQDRYGAGTNMLRTPWAKYGPLTLAVIGEPLEAAVRAAHRRGLEIFGVLKPYHTGMSATYPEGSPDSDPATPMRRIGGSLQCFNPFMERFPTHSDPTPSREGSAEPAGRSHPPDPADQAGRLPHSNPGTASGDLEQSGQLSVRVPAGGLPA